VVEAAKGSAATSSPRRRRGRRRRRRQYGARGVARGATSNADADAADTVAVADGADGASADAVRDADGASANAPRPTPEDATAVVADSAVTDGAATAADANAAFAHDDNTNGAAAGSAANGTTAAGAEVDAAAGTADAASASKGAGRDAHGRGRRPSGHPGCRDQGGPSQARRSADTATLPEAAPRHGRRGAPASGQRAPRHTPPAVLGRGHGVRGGTARRGSGPTGRHRSAGKQRLGVARAGRRLRNGRIGRGARHLCDGEGRRGARLASPHRRTS
jgi:hypothetical protein